MLMGEIGVQEKQLCESHSRCLGAAHGRVRAALYKDRQSGGWADFRGQRPGFNVGPC